MTECAPRIQHTSGVYSSVYRALREPTCWRINIPLLYYYESIEMDSPGDRIGYIYHSFRFTNVLSNGLSDHLVCRAHNFLEGGSSSILRWYNTSVYFTCSSIHNVPIYLATERQFCCYFTGHSFRCLRHRGEYCIPLEQMLGRRRMAHLFCHCLYRPSFGSLIRSSTTFY